MDLNKLDPLRVAATCSALTAIGTLTEYLFSRRELTWRLAFATTLYGILAGGGIGLCWYNYFYQRGNILFLMGVSAFAGLGGIHFLRALVKVVGTILIGMWSGLKNIRIQNDESK